MSPCVKTTIRPRRTLPPGAGLACLLAATRATAAPEPPVARSEGLAQEARLPAILALVERHNPEVAEVDARVRAAAARARARGRLPSPDLKYEQWGVPLAQPYDLGRADMVMLGLRQTLPAWGARAAEARAAQADTAMAAAGARQRRQELLVEARRAFARYYLADREVAVHREHVALTAELVNLARLHYQSGRGSQQDVLRLSLELSRLHGDLTTLEQERRANRALLNALMGRPVEAPLGPAAEYEEGDSGDPASGDAPRPEVEAAAGAVARGEAEVDRARREARLPTVMLGLDYQRMPMGHVRNGYGAMVALSLPWLWGDKRDRLDTAEESLRADQHALAAARTAAAYDLAAASARVEGAREGLAVIDRDLLPQARRSFEAARAGYGAGQTDAFALLDSLRSYLQIRIERVRAIARLLGSQADLARARGHAGDTKGGPR